MSTGQNIPIYFCKDCKVFCSSALHLSDHIVGSKHRNAVIEDNPEALENLQRLQYFLDTYLKDEPMIGLEYVVEYFKDGTYSYKCCLCDTDAKRGNTVLHLSGTKHRKLYLEKHHPELLNRQSFYKRTEQTQHIKAIALQVQSTYGRKRISEAVGSAEAPKLPSTKLNHLEGFKTIDDFMEYLRNFEIKNDGDASFVQQITKNCTNALMKYREEQTKTQTSSTLPSNSDPKRNKNPSDKARLSSINLHKESFTPAQIPSFLLNSSVATESFFQSIKDMDASEVSDVLKRITDTNPAFQGINIPSLIKYLQDTGRLKNS
ncbi:uncharacterized protein [Ranitomeya imitator]|uniref:uncharacterized protein isoform X1 n=1 Tax=Ranitomeya imitator TaxID=111125 RepID=UPI0037E8E89D